MLADNQSIVCFSSNVVCKNLFVSTILKMGKKLNMFTATKKHYTQQKYYIDCKNHSFRSL